MKLLRQKKNRIKTFQSILKGKRKRKKKFFLMEILFKTYHDSAQKISLIKKFSSLFCELDELRKKKILNKKTDFLESYYTLETNLFDIV